MTLQVGCFGPVPPGFKFNDQAPGQGDLRKVEWVGGRGPGGAPRVLLRSEFPWRLFSKVKAGAVAGAREAPPRAPRQQRSSGAAAGLNFPGVTFLLRDYR